MALQLRRGTNAQRLGMTPAVGELIYVTNFQSVPVAPLWIGDGVTVGGNIAATLSLDELVDVQIGGAGGIGLGNNQHLQYNSTDQLWRNVDNVNVPGTLTVFGDTVLGNDVLDEVLFNSPLVNAPNNFRINNGNHIFVETATGFVGIGDGTPTYKLDVAGSIRSQANLFVDNNTTLGSSSADTVTLNAGLITAPNNFRVNSGNHIFVETATGFVGIGDDTPSYKLDVTGSIRSQVNLFVDGNTTLGTASGDTITMNASTVSTPNNLNFDSGLLFIDAANNRIGINDATPSEALDVTGNAKFSGTGFIGGNTTLNNGTVLTNSGNVFLFDTVATTVDAFGAATAINFGAFMNGTTTINHNLKVASIISTDATTNATNTTNGSIQTDGGVSVTQDIFVGGLGTITGDLAVNGGDLTTTAATGNLFNTTATTVNIGGAATTMSIGNSAGTVTIPGNLTVNGTTTTINSQTLLVADKNIEMGVVAVPTDVTADGGGIILKGTTDKTILWDSATTRWISNVGFNATGAKLGNVSIADGANDNTITTTSGNLILDAATNLVEVDANLAVNGTTLTLDADNIGAGANSTIAANRGSSGADATLTWDESTGSWTFNNNVYGSGQIIGGTSIGTNGNDIYFNNNDTGTGTTSTLTVKRGTQPDVAIRWFESPLGAAFDRWQTTTDGTNYINIPDQELDELSSVKFEKVTFYNQADVDCRAYYAAPGPIQETVISSSRNVMKCLVHISQYGNDFHTVEALVLKTGPNSAMVTTYGEMYSSTPLATFAADCVTGTLRLLATPTNNIGSMLISSVITSLT